jgi:CheY-like chemotaxis protein
MPMPEMRGDLPPLVLVVEDDELVANAVEDCLLDWGFRVLRAENAVQAIDLLSSGNKVSLVLSDVIMPGGMDGFGLARWIRAHCDNKVRLMLTSGYFLPGMPALELGDAPLLPKPYKWEDLRRRVTELLSEPR